MFWKDAKWLVLVAVCSAALAGVGVAVATSDPIPPGPPGLPVDNSGTPEYTGSEADIAPTTELPGGPSATSLVNCLDGDTRLGIISDYGPGLGLAVASGAESTEASPSSSSPVSPAPEVVIADWLSLPNRPAVNPAFYKPHQTTSTYALYRYDPPTTVKRILSAILLQRRGGEWTVAEFSACGELIHPESTVTNQIGG